MSPGSAIEDRARGSHQRIPAWVPPARAVPKGFLQPPASGVECPMSHVHSIK